MSITVEIELEHMENPAVAEALSGLMLALARVSPSVLGSSSRKAASKPRLSPEDEAERYESFVRALPERSRKFLDLVKERKILPIKDAMEALEIDVPKAMGGITGSIGRWAPVRGVPIPYEAIKVNGERAWRWVGAPDEVAGE